MYIIYENQFERKGTTNEYIISSKHACVCNAAWTKTAKQFNESSCSRCVSHTDVSDYFLLWEDVSTPLWHVTCSSSTEAFRDRVHVSKHICDVNLQPDVEKSVPKRRLSQYTEMHWLIESAWDTLTIILMSIRTQRRMLCVISISKTQ